MKTNVMVLFLFIGLLFGVYCSNSSRTYLPSTFSDEEVEHRDEETGEKKKKKKKKKRRRRRRSRADDYYGGGSSPSPASSSAGTPAPEEPAVSLDTVVSGFCSRNLMVQKAILEKISGATCSTITVGQLAAITSLTIPDPPGPIRTMSQRAYGSSHSPRTNNDFKGLRGLRTFETGYGTRWDRNSLPNDFFSDFDSIEKLDFDEDNIYYAQFKQLLKSLPLQGVQTLREINFGTDIGEIGCTRRSSERLDSDLLTHLGATGVNCPPSCPQYGSCDCTLNDPSPSIVIKTVCPP